MSVAMIAGFASKAYQTLFSQPLEADKSMAYNNPSSAVALLNPIVPKSMVKISQTEGVKIFIL
jgi:hypothetical protein